MKLSTLLAAAVIASATLFAIPAQALNVVDVAKITAAALKDGYEPDLGNIKDPTDDKLVKKSNGIVVIDPPDIKAPDVTTVIPEKKLPDVTAQKSTANNDGINQRTVSLTNSVLCDKAVSRGLDPEDYWACDGKWQQDNSINLGQSTYIIPGDVIPGKTVVTIGATTITPPFDTPVCNSSVITFTHSGHNPLTGFTQVNSTGQTNGKC